MLPPIKGLVHDDGGLPERVAAFRTLDDCRRILALAERAGPRARARRRPARAGGGPRAGRAGLAVTVLHAVGHLMERQLDPPARAGARGDAGPARRRGRARRWPPRRDRGRRRPGRGGARRRPAARGRPARGGLRRAARATGLAERPGSPSTAASWSTTGCAPATRTSSRSATAPSTTASSVGWSRRPGTRRRVVADVLTGVRPLARYRPRAAGDPAQGDRDRPRRDGRRRPAHDGDAVTFADPARGTYAKLRHPATTGWPAPSCWATTRPSAR